MTSRIRLLSALLSLILVLSLFVGCGAKKSGGSPVPTDADITGQDSEKESTSVSDETGEPADASGGDFVFVRKGDGEVSLDVYRGVSETVVIPSTDPETGFPVTEIGVWAFRDNDTVKEITVPDSVTVIGDNAFMYCSALETVSLPDSLEKIGKQAFYRCSSLLRITIPDGVKEIEYAQFMLCESMTEIVIPAGIAAIGENAFSQCTSLVNIFYKGSDADWGNVEKAGNAMPPTWYNISYYYGQW